MDQQRAEEPQRRRLLRILAIVGVAVVAVAVGTTGVLLFLGAKVDTVGSVDFRHPLTYPTVVEGALAADGAREFELVMQSGTHDFGEAVAPTWGINGPHLAPTLRMSRGDTVRMKVANDLPETSTLHWHGMHLPAAMDGGPHQTIAPGAQWTPEWTVDQPAATLWYHPHLHGSTAAHAYRGLAGMIIVEDEESPALPSDYGIDDLPLVVQDVKFDREGRLDEREGIGHVGILGDRMAVNGTIGAFAEITAEATRLRILNASVSRVLTFVFDDGRDFAMIASDGGLLSAPVELSRLQLTPGERAEIVVRMEPGETVVLRSEAAENSDRFNGGDDRFDILQLRAAEALAPSPALPAALAVLPEISESDAVNTRVFDLDEPRINGQVMDMSRIDEVVTVDTTEVWEVRNADGKVHNFHIHDTQFRVLSIGGREPPPELAGWKDTVFTPPNQTVRLLVRFTDYTDPDMPYMYHCHILRHEDRGMMGQFVVVEPGQQAGTIPHREHDH